MTILKLPHEGDTHTALIDRCAVEQGKYGDQVIFEFGLDRLYLPKLSADRQLLRCGFGKGGGSLDDTGSGLNSTRVIKQVDYEQVAGNILCFSRDHNSSAPDKPYWGITIATGDAPPPRKRMTEVLGIAPKVPATKTTTVSAMQKASTPPVTRSRQQVAAAYAWCLQTVTAAQVAAFPKPTPDSIQSGAATLLIQLEKSGLLFEPITLATVVKALDLTPPSQFEEPLPEYNEDNLPF